MTLVHFASILLWRIFVSAQILFQRWLAAQQASSQTLPLRFAVNFYELQIRRKFPWLPSIWKTLQTLFPSGIKIPTLTSLTAGPYKGAGPSGPDLPTFDASAEIDAIVNGGENGNGNASSPIESSRSKLEIALKKIPATSPGDLEARLADVKVSNRRTTLAPELISLERPRRRRQRKYWSR